LRNTVRGDRRVQEGRSTSLVDRLRRVQAGL